MKKLRAAFFTLLAVAVVLAGIIAMWMMNPTRSYYEPIAAKVYHGDDGEWRSMVTRALPRGDVYIRWSMTVWVRRGEVSYACHEPMGHPILYSDDMGLTLSYELPPSVVRCLDQAPPISVTWTRQAVLFGFIPLVPVRTTVMVEGGPRAFSNGDG